MEGSPEGHSLEFEELEKCERAAAPPACAVVG
jgi:hypothetical protein